MIFRLFHERRGGHVHCRMFAEQHEGALGKCGDLCMKVAEFDKFSERFAGIEMRPELKREVDRLNLERHSDITDF